MKHAKRIVTNKNLEHFPETDAFKDYLPVFLKLLSPHYTSENVWKLNLYTIQRKPLLF